jgi:beta-xylosidase
MALTAMAALAVAVCVRGADATLRLPEMPLHDPWIVADRASQTYYLYTSNIGQMSGTPGVGTMVYTSRDLLNWTRPKVVFSLPSGTWADSGGWAPEVHRWRGKWWLFTTLHRESSKLRDHSPFDEYRRGTVAAVAERLEGPFTLVRDGEPIAPKSLMTLDGTLYVDPAGRPWFVFAHEWLQAVDGTMEALPLTSALEPAGPSRVLFKASEAAWVAGQPQNGPGMPPGTKAYVTDGPELFRTRTNQLLMLWSSYDEKGYVQSQARSKTGRIEGPWEQLEPLVRNDSGHGMLFHRFDGQLMMVLHRPFKNARGKLYEMRDAGDHLEVIRERTDLDGDL